jgi:2'-5' RNA ligase
MRLFLAVALTDADRQKLDHIRRHLASARADVKWVEAENLHLTLRFLGEVSSGRVGQIEDVVQPVVQALPMPQVCLGGLGTFPPNGPPRVVWCGFQRGTEALRRLVQKLSDVLTGLGFEPEQRRYTPHVTLGRVRSRRNSDVLRHAIETMPAVAFDDFTAHEIVLIESQLSRSGARYAVRRRFGFGRED